MSWSNALEIKPLRLTGRKDILLVIPPPFFTSMPHIGVAYLSQYLEHHGISTGIYDLSVKLFNQSGEDLKEFWRVEANNRLFISEIAQNIMDGCREGIDQFIDDFLFTKTKIIGFSVNISSLFIANFMSKAIKERAPETLIIFGGAGTYFNHPRDLAQPSFADIYVLGEGEQALLNIIRDFYNNTPIVTAPGILLRQDVGQRSAIPAQEIAQVDDIPFPTFEGFNLQEYNLTGDSRLLPLLLSRGCVRCCSYCIDYIIWPKYRFRSPKKIMEEIQYHLLNNRTEVFHFNDLSCNGNLEQLSELCDLIIESGHLFKWVSYALVRKDMTAELFYKMKKAGCHTLIFGVETGSDRVLKLMRKPYTAREASQVLRLSHEAGIQTNMNVIVGFPGETESDFNATVGFLEENHPVIDEVSNVNGFTVFPDAEVGMNQGKYGIVPDKSGEWMLFKDRNGLDREGRLKRVERLMETVESFNLRKGFISKPALNPKVITLKKKEKTSFFGLGKGEK